MDKGLLIAVVLSVLVVVGYQEYLRIYYPQPTKAEETKRPDAPPATRAAGVEGAVPVPPIPSAAEEAAAPVAVEPDVVVESDLFIAKLSSRGARLVSFLLKNYRTTVDPGSPLLDMVSAGTDYPLAVTFRGERTSGDRDVAYEPSKRTIRLGGHQEDEVVFRGALADGTPIEKRIRFRGARYDFDVGIDLGGDPAGVQEAGLAWAHRNAPVANDNHWVGAEALIDKKLLNLASDKLVDGVIYPNPRDPSMATATAQWVGYADSYFLSAIAPNSEDSVRAWLKLQNDTVVAELLLPLGAVRKDVAEYTVYVGPKDLDHLTPAGHHLQRALDLGWFSILAEFLLRILKVFHRATGNYGVDIILLTVLIKVLFIPLTKKSFESMQAMQRLQPEMKKLQERFKDDREALNREMMELYRRHKVNPLGGCLPMLLQMPVFIGLYNALFYAVELRHAPFALWINDLSAPDRLPALPSAPLAVLFDVDVRIPVLTLLMGASMLVQQRMSPPVGDPAQQRMMMFMPVVFTVMFVSFPSGLVLYWFVNNVLTVAQQALMQRTPAK